MKLGIDASTYFEVLAKKPHYFYKQQEVEPLSFLKVHNGLTSFRIRLWLNPFSKEGKAYGGGTDDWPTFLKLAKLVNSLGYGVLLDFHYSDFWCDPAKQTLPKEWANYTLEETCKALYAYTKNILTKCVNENIKLSGIQIGNEITNGMCWPLGKLNWIKEGVVREGYDALAMLLKSGIKAAREVTPSIPLIIHLEKSGDLLLHQEFFSEITKRNVDFDVIGLSYYPYWHGTFAMFFKNVSNLKALFKKPIWIVETGYGFTMAPFIDSENGGANLISEDFFKKNEGTVFKPYPLTKEGQRDFIKELVRLSNINGIDYIYYWEPLWLPLKGLEWASIEGERYIHETNKPTHNEWANQCLFDYEGNATPALDEFKL
jgi:arabinogalactan endo-1,4-beta-galactosidase